MNYDGLDVENKHVPNNIHTVMIINSSSKKFEAFWSILSKLAPKETHEMLTKSIAIMVLHQSIKSNVQKGTVNFHCSFPLLYYYYLHDTSWTCSHHVQRRELYGLKQWMRMFKNLHFVLPYYWTLVFPGVVYACAQQHPSNCRDMARILRHKREGLHACILLSHV